MTKQRFEVVVFYEQPDKQREIIKRLYVWVDMSEIGRNGRDEYVYARVRESEGI